MIKSLFNAPLSLFNFLIALVLVMLLTAASAQAAPYDVTVTMPLTSGGGVPTGCQLYLNNTAVAGGSKACGQPVTYPALLTADGTYAFSYTLRNSAGETTRSPVRNVTVTTQQLPNPPTSPPVLSVACDPSPCPATITITVTP